MKKLPLAPSPKQVKKWVRIVLLLLDLAEEGDPVSRDLLLRILGTKFLREATAKCPDRT